MTKQELMDWAIERGWKLDLYGHLKREKGGKIYRLKLSRIAVRYEIKSSAGWVRLRGGYYSKLNVTPDGKLSGLGL